MVPSLSAGRLEPQLLAYVKRQGTFRHRDNAGTEDDLNCAVYVLFTNAHISSQRYARHPLNCRLSAILLACFSTGRTDHSIPTYLPQNRSSHFQFLPCILPKCVVLTLAVIEHQTDVETKTPPTISPTITTLSSRRARRLRAPSSQTQQQMSA